MFSPVLRAGLTTTAASTAWRCTQSLDHWGVRSSNGRCGNTDGLGTSAPGRKVAGEGGGRAPMLFAHWHMIPRDQRAG